MYPEFPRESTNILPRKNGSLLQTIVIRNCQEDKTTMLSRSLPASKAVMPTDVDPLNTLRHLLFLKRLSFSLECAIPRAERGARAIPLWAERKLLLVFRQSYLSCKSHETSYVAEWTLFFESSMLFGILDLRWRWSRSAYGWELRAESWKNITVRERKRHWLEEQDFCAKIPKSDCIGPLPAGIVSHARRWQVHVKVNSAISPSHQTEKKVKIPLVFLESQRQMALQSESLKWNNELWDWILLPL